MSIDDFIRKNGGVCLTYNGRKKIWREFLSFVDIINPQIDKEIANIKVMINEKV